MLKPCCKCFPQVVFWYGLYSAVKFKIRGAFFSPFLISEKCLHFKSVVWACEQCDWSKSRTCSSVWQLLSPLPGLLHDKLGSYDVAFYLAGIPPFIGGVVLCLIPWIHRKKQRKGSKNTGGEKTERMLDKQRSLLPGSSGIFKKDSDSIIWPCTSPPDCVCFEFQASFPFIWIADFLFF